MLLVGRRDKYYGCCEGVLRWILLLTTITYYYCYYYYYYYYYYWVPVVGMGYVVLGLLAAKKQIILL